MQGIGVGVAEEPLLRDLRAAGNGAAYRDAVARGAQFFNAHPYLCGLAVGAAARAEHDGLPPAQVARLRAALCGPLGALGDRLVWAGWLPFTSALALIGVAAGLGLSAGLGVLVVYNAGHVTLRWWGLRAGWTHGAPGAAALPAAEFVKLANRFAAAVQVRKDDLTVNGKSIMGVMMLAAECGASLFIRTEGADAEAAMEALLALVADGFHEMHLTSELRDQEREEEEEKEQRGQP